LRDGGRRYGGFGVLKAVFNVNSVISKMLIGEDSREQEKIDKMMIEADSTENKSRFGANSILSVSGAIARAAADTAGLALYRYLGGSGNWTMPVPLMNVINGGLHAGNELKIQEFMIAPIGFDSFREALAAAAETYMTLRDVIKEVYGKNAINIGDEGGFAPPMKNTRDALLVLSESIKKAGYSDKIFILLDCAATNFYDKEKNKYLLDGMELEPGDLLEYYSELVDEYNIVSIEDPFHEEDFESFSELTEKLGNKVQIVGDDIFVTNVKRIEIGIAKRAANAVLIKPNQVGTITETFEAIRTALRAGYSVIISHRSGETEDSFIADLSVAVRAGQIKAGAPCRGERVAKYNRLIEIEDELPDSRYYGERFFRRAVL
ncbi:MAG: phosphopyruvate hydratase, partial [Candidatus Methanodesulfokora sp.]